MCERGAVPRESEACGSSTLSEGGASVRRLALAHVLRAMVGAGRGRCVSVRLCGSGGRRRAARRVGRALVADWAGAEAEVEADA